MPQLNNNKYVKVNTSRAKYTKANNYEHSTQFGPEVLLSSTVHVRPTIVGVSFRPRYSNITQARFENQIIIGAS